MTIEVVLGIDIGGTNTAFGLVDNAGTCHFKSSVPTESEKPFELLAQSIVDVINDYNKTQNNQLLIKGIGIGAPNANYYTGYIDNPPNLKWKQVNLVEIFQKHMHVPVIVTNDANAAAFGELQFGSAKNMKNFIEITLGTGLGSGLIVNGEMVYGNDGYAGELGHVVVEKDGRLCGCGRKGCLETYASATGIRKTVLELIKKNGTTSSLAEVPAEKLTAKMISEEAEKGDALALEAFQFTADILGRAMADAVAYMSPEAIVFFGGLAQAGDLLFKPLQETFESSLLSIYKGKVKLFQSGLKAGDAAILGAGALAWHELDLN